MNIVPSPTQPTETISLTHFNRLCNALAAEVTRIQASNVSAHQKQQQTADVYHRLMRLTLAGQWVRPEGNMRRDIGVPPTPDLEDLVGHRSINTLCGCSRPLPFTESVDIHLFPDPHTDFTKSDFQYKFVQHVGCCSPF